MRNTKLTQEEIDRIIRLYSEVGSILEVRKITGNGMKTICKYLSEAGIKLKKVGCSGGGSKPKITDEELIEESKYLTRDEIAEKHNMNVCNVDRRIKRLGIKCASGLGRGQGHSRYSHRCSVYGSEYDKSITLRSVYEKHNGVCGICGKPVDVNDRNGNIIGKLYPSIDHIIPVSKGGSHTWDNVQLAHMMCNSLKGDRA